jgi:hypothetical protein
MNTPRVLASRVFLLLAAAASPLASGGCYDDAPYSRSKVTDAGDAGDESPVPDTGPEADAGDGDGDLVDLADLAEDVPEVCPAVYATDALDFGMLPIGEFLSLDTGIHVLCSDAPTVPSPFGVSAEGDNYAITFRPVAEAAYEDTVTFETHLGAREIALSGVAFDPARCPMARITPLDLTVGDNGCLEVETSIGSLVVLSAADSEAFGLGRVEEYDWVIRNATGAQVSRGSGETCGLLPSPGATSVELDVIDSIGRRSCEPARLCISATTEADLVVELTWEVTPAWHPDDWIRVDLDLHLVHPDGWWGESTYDCAVGNRTCLWGEPGTHVGDPVVEDSITGSSPERLEMAVAEPLVYKLGVFSYFLPDGADTTATVRVWIRGELVLEMQRLFVTNGLLWEVGEVSMASGVNVVDILHEGMP